MLLLVFFIFLTDVPISIAKPLVGVVSVIDGDTVEMHGKRIRLFGIDAPESRQICTKDWRPWLCGKSSAFALSEKIGYSPIFCETENKTDRYGREVAICQLNGENLNAWMVKQGWALAYRQYSKAYITYELEARNAKLGIWASEFIPPWEWRKQSRHQR